MESRMKTQASAPCSERRDKQRAALSHGKYSTLSPRRSFLRELIVNYSRTLQSLSDGLDAKKKGAAYLRAEMEAVAKMTAHLADIEFLSCTNSPFFSSSVRAYSREEKLSYTRRILKCITSNTYDRFPKVLLLLLCEFRFIVLKHDAACFSEFHSRDYPQTCASGEMSDAVDDARSMLMYAFKCMGSLCHSSVDKMQAERNAMCKSKTFLFSKQLMDAFEKVVSAITSVSNKRSVLDSYISWFPESVASTAAEYGIADTLEKYNAASYWEKQKDCLLARVTKFEEAHTRFTTGTQFSALCGQLRSHVSAAFGVSVIATRAPKVSAATAVESLSCLSNDGGVRAVEAPLAEFFDVVENMRKEYPSLWAMNYLLSYYGVDEASMLAHEADVVDGEYRRQLGSIFETQSLVKQIELVSSQILVPHCCEVTGCDEPTAKGWVQVCMGCKATKIHEVVEVSTTWLKTPPVYRLARNVKYYKRADSEKTRWSLLGEIDGIIYDARTLQVLFLLEAKLNSADLGTALNQKERLYKALDSAWLTAAKKIREEAPAEKPHLPERGADTSTARTESLSPHSAPSTVPSEPNELRFSLSFQISLKEACNESHVDKSLSDDAVKEASKSGEDIPNTKDMLAVAASPVMGSKKVSASSAATPVSSFFTEDNFSAFFRETGAATHSDPADFSSTLERGNRVASQELGRDHRWVFLTSVVEGSSSDPVTLAPTPSGSRHIVEKMLVLAISKYVDEAYHFATRKDLGSRAATPNLNSLVTSMLRASFFFGSAGGPSTPFDFPIDFSPQGCPCGHDRKMEECPSNLYRRILHFCRHSNHCKRSTSPRHQVRAPKNLSKGFDLPPHTLTTAANTIVKITARGISKSPLFSDVVQKLIQQKCVRNLIILERM